MSNTSAKTTQDAPFTGHAVILELRPTETHAFICKWTPDAASKITDPETLYTKQGGITNETAKSVSRYLHLPLAEMHAKLAELDPNARTIPVLLLSEADFKSDEPELYEAVKSRIDNAFYTKGSRFKVFESDVAPASPPKPNGDGDMERDWDDRWKAELKKFSTIETKFAVIQVAEAANGTEELSYYPYRYRRITNVKISDMLPKINPLDKVNQLSEQTFSQHQLSNPGASTDVAVFLTKSHKDKPTLEDGNFKYQVHEYEAQDPSTGKETFIEEHHKDVVCRVLTESTKAAVLIDAGSSGTRIFLYTWKERFNSAGEAVLPESVSLLPGWNRKSASVEGGIAKLAPKMSDGVFKDKDGTHKFATAVASETFETVSLHLTPIFEYVRSRIETCEALQPKKDPLHAKDNRAVINSIPLIMLATGGMRVLRQSQYQSYKILCKAITKYINASGFLEPQYSTISGEDEGLFGWVAANYNNKRFFSNSEETRGFMEMGGQSAQIAFVPREGDKKNYWGPLTNVKVGGRVFDLFTKTWNMLGADAMWKKHEERLRESDTVIVHDPCLPKQYSYKLGDSDKTIVGTGDLIQCVKETFLLLGCEDEECRAGKLCALNGRGGCLLKDIPGLGYDEQGRSFQGASVFWNATNGVFGAKPNGSGGTKNGSADGSYNLVKFWKEAKDLFSYDWSKIKDLRPHEKENGYQYLPRAFFKAGLIMSSLHLGFGVPMPKLATAAVEDAVAEHMKEVMGADENGDVMKGVINFLKKPFLDIIKTMKMQFGDKISQNPSGSEIIGFLRNLLPDLVQKLKEVVKNVQAPDKPSGVKKAIENFQIIVSSAGDEQITKALYKAVGQAVGVFVDESAWEDPEKAVEGTMEKAIRSFVSELLVESDYKAIADDKFTTVKEASWTLGRAILCATYSEPKVQTRRGWEKPVDKPVEQPNDGKSDKQLLAQQPSTVEPVVAGTPDNVQV